MFMFVTENSILAGKLNIKSTNKNMIFFMRTHLND